MITGRLNILAMVDPFVGKYYSPTYVKRHILRLEDDEIEEMDAENEEHNKEQLAQELAKQRMQGDLQNEIQADAPQPKGK